MITRMKFLIRTKVISLRINDTDSSYKLLIQRHSSYTFISFNISNIEENKVALQYLGRQTTERDRSWKYRLCKYNQY